jgi:hypothetical protein
MKQSVEVTEDQISEALTLLGINLRRRLIDKGRDSFINPKETLGDLRLEMNEVEQAVQIKEPQRIIEELLDVAVGCVFGVASIKAHAQVQEAKKPIQGGK